MTGSAFHTHAGQETTIIIKPVIKSATAYRTISEAADELAVPQHVLRFWETKFSQIRPMKRSGGRRFYRPEDITLLQSIKALLYDNGYTIKGVQRLLKLRRGMAGMPHNADADGHVMAMPEPPALLTLKPQISLRPHVAAADAPDHTDDLADDMFSAIPGHLPGKPAALMAEGIMEGRPRPTGEEIPPAAMHPAVPALSAGQREQLGAVLGELRMLRDLLA